MVSGEPFECDCPSCSGADLDPRQLVEVLLATADLTGFEDPLDAELVGACVMSIGATAGEDLEGALVGALVPELEVRADSEALSMLLAIGSIAEGSAGQVASAAADRLVRAGVPAPPWSAELRAPVTVGDCWRLSDSEGTGSMLACSFHREGRSHAVVIGVDHLDCGAAGDILVFDVERLPGALEKFRAVGRDEGLAITTESLDPGEFRWHVENALDARAVHDSALADEETAQFPVGEDGPGYPTFAALVRNRMKNLPTIGRPGAPHGDDDEVAFAALQMLAQLAEGAGRPFGARAMAPGRAPVAALPSGRPKSDLPPPVYQIKVGLRGAKPPIWRRLEVPATISLARLHTTIQIAFGWADSHLHVFETPYGSFGAADADLDHRSDTEVTLEQVAPAVNSKLRYTYDFGDDWDHDIRVEKVLDHNGTVPFPRCTGGRRAAPPDDCGGIMGYAELVEVLRDPADEEHNDRLEWLGLDDAAEFDPDAFDAAAVTCALSRMR